MASKRSPMKEYLSKVDPKQRTALEKVCKAIRAAAAEAVEGVSYGMPAFLVKGKAIAALLCCKGHCSYFPMSGRVVAAMSKELAGYDASKGTIRFTVNKPLSAAVVRKAIKLRLAEIAGKPSTRTVPAAKKVKVDSEVTEYLKKLKHPLKPGIEALRELILAVSPTIQEGIKWNSPSFRTSDYFATMNLRGSKGEERIWLILHTGAKGKTGEVKVADPEAMLKWLAKDRCMVTFTDGEDVRRKGRSLQAIVREWIRNLD